MGSVLATSAATHVFEREERRVDGDLKVSGQAQYTADFSMPGMLWAEFVSSTVAHAKIVSIDTAAAKALPGVHAVLTGADIGEHYFGRRMCDWPVLALDRVRFIGEFVAAVAADSPQIAEAAAALIDVEYEDLEPLFDSEIALSPAAPILHEHPEKYPFMFPTRPSYPHKNIQGHGIYTVGDIDEGFALADRVFEYTFTTPRYIGGYIEPRATLVWIDGKIANIVSTTKSPFGLIDQFAVATGLPKENFVVHPSFIGGDFGAKGLSVEEFPCYFLAVATGRPVKYVRSYLDDIRSTSTRHAARVTVKTGVTKNGKFVAQSVYALYDGGAYAAGKPIPTMLPGPEVKVPYGIPHQKHERIVVYTNTIPGGFVRAPGEIQIAFATESAMDLIAHELGIDPLELRLLNAVQNGDMDIEGHPHLDPCAVEVLETLKRESNWGAPLPAGRARGLALAARHIGAGSTKMHIELRSGGGILVRMGATEQGMGILTVLSRVVSADLGVPEERITVTRGTTAEGPFDPGVGASRTTHISGQAALDACRLLREKLEEVSGMTLRDGSFRSSDGVKTRSWEDVAAEALRANGGRLAVLGSYNGDHAPGEPEYNGFAGYVVDASVDRETGQCTVHNVWFCCDSGTIINPIAHRGQIDGGFLMGYGLAVTEELLLEEGRITNLSFADYKMPCQRDMPPFHVTILEKTIGPGPFGARAVGEINVSSVAPALANAIASACGVRLATMPLTAERIFAALHPS